MTTLTQTKVAEETISKHQRPDILEITDLHAEIDGQEILKGINLTIN